MNHEQIEKQAALASAEVRGEQMRVALELLLNDIRAVASDEPPERSIPAAHRAADIRQGRAALSAGKGGAAPDVEGRAEKTITERITRFEPGHDCIRFECVNGRPSCRPGAGGSHGVHGLTLRFLVKGAKGTVQFVIHTGWLPEPQGLRSDRRIFPAMPSDLGYHAIEPKYEGQSALDCEWTPGGKCYYDGSSLNAEEPFRILSNDGEAALWEFLEAYYMTTFDGGEWPKGQPYKRAKRQA